MRTSNVRPLDLISTTDLSFQRDAIYITYPATRNEHLDLVKIGCENSTAEYISTRSLANYT